ncbi:MAG: hypothetical protein HY331_02385 [Chloroflexi bacterium]|nr:hypothetical protein [Chloroflexota bacterium]
MTPLPNQKPETTNQEPRARSAGPVALVSTVHDPEARLLPRLLALWSDAVALYGAQFAVATRRTHPAILERLGAGGRWQFEDRPGEIGSARRQAVSLAAAAGFSAMHYCDLDRWLHWRQTSPAELEQVLRLIPTVDFLLIGRTARAFQTHPRVQTETEALTNAACSAFFGREVDVAAGSCGLAGLAVAAILAESVESTNATDAEWPAIVHCRGGTVAYRAVEGLEFETAAYYPDQIARAGGLGPWLEARSRSLAEWDVRTRLTYESVRALRRVAEGCSS